MTFLALIVFSGHVQGKGLVCREDHRVSMACTYSIRACSRDAKMIDAALDAAFAEIDRIDRLMSNYRQDSPLSEINRNASAGPVKTDPELFDFLRLCNSYSQTSRGAFDITVGPLMKAWGFFGGEGHKPEPAQLREAFRKVGYQKLELDTVSHSVRFLEPGMELDLGGIAKGYAVDRAAAVLKSKNIEAALISAGGSTTLGYGRPWKVKIDDPLKPGKPVLTVILRNRCLSVSGTREKYFESGGKRYSHIMDPRTGTPVMGIISVAVITSTGTAGDALDNVLFVSGLKASHDLLREYPGTQAYFFLPSAASAWKLSILGQNRKR